MAGQKNRKMDRPYFIGPFWLHLGDQPWVTNCSIVRHLKVKGIEYDVGLTKNYWITNGLQKISSIHKLTLKKNPVLTSDELNGHAHF